MVMMMMIEPTMKIITRLRHLIMSTITSLTILMLMSTMFNNNINYNFNNYYAGQYRGLISLVNCDHRLNESFLASQHLNRILKYAKCQHPYAKVVNIQNELHPNAIKKYIPHCTILHYCGQSTGCCRLENEHCVAKKIEDVKLYFWTIELTSKGHKKGIEMITMQNHTECMCAPINHHNHHHDRSSSINSKLPQHTKDISTLRFDPISTTTTTTTESSSSSTNHSGLSSRLFHSSSSSGNLT